MDRNRNNRSSSINLDRDRNSPTPSYRNRAIGSPNYRRDNNSPRYRVNPVRDIKKETVKELFSAIQNSDVQTVENLLNLMKANREYNLDEIQDDNENNIVNAIINSYYENIREDEDYTFYEDSDEMKILKLILALYNDKSLSGHTIVFGILDSMINFPNEDMNSMQHVAYLDAIVPILLQAYRDNPTLFNEVRNANNGKNMLMIAAGNNDILWVDTLLETDEFINSLNNKDNNGDTALMLAVSNGSLNAIKSLLRFSDKINLNDTDQSGDTVLMTAILKDNKEIINLLFEEPGIDMFKTNNTGVSVYAISQIKPYIKAKFDKYQQTGVYYPSLTKVVTTNKQQLKECDNNNDIPLSQDFLKYFKNIFDFLKVDYANLSLLSKKELCSQFQAYQDYLVFNERMGNKRISTIFAQKSIFNHNTLPPKSVVVESTLYKTFPLNHNGLPFIYTIELTGNRDEFTFLTFLYFPNHDITVDDGQDIFEIKGKKKLDSTIHIDLFWTVPGNLKVIPKYASYKPQLKGIGKRCLCLLFKYFLDFGYISPNTIVDLDAAGSQAIINNNLQNDPYFNQALDFIKKYNQDLYNHILSRYQYKDDKNIILYTAPYRYTYSEKPINLFLNLVYENMKLINYYRTLGFEIDEEYYLKPETKFQPLYVRLKNTVSGLISRC
jgi:hypothetical protein